MQKRRERIEMWRDERKKAAEAVPSAVPVVSGLLPPNAKKWSLEDDEDDDEIVIDDGEDGEKIEEEEEEEEDVDPLDAYMMVKAG